MVIGDCISINTEGISIYKNDELICSIPNTKHDVTRFPSASESKQRTRDTVWLQGDCFFEGEILAIKLKIEAASINQKFAILWQNDLKENTKKILTSLGYKFLDVYDNKEKPCWVIYWE